MQGFLGISLQFLTVNYTLICYFLLIKTVQLTIFYCKITQNVWFDLLRFSLYIVWELPVNFFLL